MTVLKDHGMTSYTNDDLVRASARRRLLKNMAAGIGLIGLAGLAGCSTRKDSLVQSHLKVARGILFPPKSARRLSREQVAKFPYASMAVKVGGRPEQLILLNRFEGQKLLWLSGDGIMLVTRNGRLVQTGGLRYNLQATHMVGPDPVAVGLLRQDGVTSLRFLDYDDEYGQTIEAKSTFRVRKSDPIDILGTTLPTVLVEERVRVPMLKWRFKNRYWVHEKSQFVWRTLQHFHPMNEPYQLTMLRPAKLPS